MILKRLHKNLMTRILNFNDSFTKRKILFIKVFLITLTQEKQ